jgi:hypothetical protein
MNFFKKTALLAGVVAVSTVSVAKAGPQVTVNFKNNSGEVALYVRGSSRNETTTYGNSSPSPRAVDAGGQHSYVVRATGSSPITYATVKYQAGSKVCQFTTSYLMNSTPGGLRTPKWNKSAVASGGARCDISIATVNYSSHDWAVTLTMR